MADLSPVIAKNMPWVNVPIYQFVQRTKLINYIQLTLLDYSSYLAFQFNLSYKMFY